MCRVERNPLRARGGERLARGRDVAGDEHDVCLDPFGHDQVVAHAAVDADLAVGEEERPGRPIGDGHLGMDAALGELREDHPARRIVSDRADHGRLGARGSRCGRGVERRAGGPEPDARVVPRTLGEDVDEQLAHGDEPNCHEDEVRPGGTRTGA